MDNGKLIHELIDNNPATKIARQQRGLLRSIVAYEPTPIERPKIDDDFGEMPVVESTLETFRYLAFLLEYTLSPNGWLRAWLVLWCRLFLLLFLPTIAATVIARLAVPLAADVADVAIHMENAARAAVVAIAWLVLGAGLIATVIAVGGWLIRDRRRRR